MPSNVIPGPPQLAVGGVCVRDGRLLLVRRGRGVAAGRWSLPGGRMEPDESLAESVGRELLEETGLTVRVEGLCGVAEREVEGQRFVIIDFWVTAEGEAAAGDDASAVRWADRGELESLPLAPGLLDFLAEHAVLDRLA